MTDKIRTIDRVNRGFLSGMTFSDFARNTQKTAFFSFQAAEAVRFADYLSNLVFLGFSESETEGTEFYRISTLSTFDGERIPETDLERISEEEFFSQAGKYGIVVAFEDDFIPSVVRIDLGEKGERTKVSHYAFRKKKLVSLTEDDYALGGCRKITVGEYEEEKAKTNGSACVKRNFVINKKDHVGVVWGTRTKVPKLVKFGSGGWNEIMINQKDNKSLKILLEARSLNYREINRICEMLRSEFNQYGIQAYEDNYEDVFAIMEAGMAKAVKFSVGDWENASDLEELIDRKFSFFATTFFHRLLTYPEDMVIFRLAKDGKLVSTNAFNSVVNLSRFKAEFETGIDLVKTLKHRSEGDSAGTENRVRIVETKVPGTFDLVCKDSKLAADLRDRAKKNHGCIVLNTERNRWHISTYPDIRSVAQANYYQKFLKICLIRSWAKKGLTEVPERFRDTFMEFVDGKITAAEEMGRLRKAFLPFAAYKIHYSIKTEIERRKKAGISFVNGGVDNFSEDGTGFFEKDE